MINIREEMYIVQLGDSLWKIANMYQVGLKELINANPNILNPNLIYPGQQVMIPSQNDFLAMVNEIIQLVNNERVKRGINPLIGNWEVSRVARFKSEDMIANNYFSHTSPIYGSPFEMLSAFGIRYTAAAENIATGQRSANSVMNSWMDSPGHRANILNPKFNEIGVGIARRGENGPYYFTQIFIRN